MAKQRKIDPFFIVVTDRKLGVFNVLGPMVDDTQITHQVAELQNKGCRLNCYTAGSGQSRQQVIDSYVSNYGLKYTDDLITA
jgi:hypothetical protein